MASARAVPQCPHCDSTDIDHDPARGDSVCVGCGAVLEESLIVSEVGFAEDSRGRSNIVGQHVNADGRPNGGGAVLPGFSREATAITMTNGRRRIWHLVSALRLTSRHAESALRLFRLAVERTFHKGRRMAHVCCACLYVVVRIERTPHMLIDFSDVLETNVYVLGHTFLKFAQILSIELPIIDPSLYIHRFASKLEFGDKTHAVGMSALRILARMRRDWMAHGRRPNGLCGAAIIVAARMHGFYRSQGDVVRVVRIGNVALRERLNELDQTATANMTAGEINAGGGDDGKVASLNGGADVPAPADPPAFQRLLVAKEKEEAEAKEAAEAKAAEKASDMGDKSGEGSIVSKEVDAAEKASGSGEGASEATPSSAPVIASGIDVSLKPAEGGRTADDAQIEKEIAAALENDELKELDKETAIGEAATDAHKGSSAANGTNDSVLSLTPGAPGGTGSMASGENQSQATASTAAANKVMGILPDSMFMRPSTEVLNVADDLSDLDDDDCAMFLNTEEEFKVKEAIWTDANRDYLEKQARLEKLKRDNPEEYARLKPWKANKKKKKNDGKAVDLPPAKNAEEAVRRVMPKATSRKLNYSVLSSLGGKKKAGESLRVSGAGAGASSARPPAAPART